MNILVLCTGNSARSIMLESLLNHFGKGRVNAFSAGARPTGQVHPQALRLLATEGHDTAGLRSKSWEAFTTASPHSPDIVITVCGNAAQSCPVWPGAPLSCHWGVDDPADCTDDCETAFKTAYNILKLRANDLLAAPFETMDRPCLQTLLNQIGQRHAQP
ncbi:MAG: low molecular weight phosphatase family protein [Rhodobacterales bacterium]|nr:MAG: low molecular weight phosphatase family protein [Rhodobacterales bacterium]